MKGSSVLSWLIGIVIIAISIATAFYFDEPVKQWMLNHQNSGTRGFMENVSRFGDWPEHVLVGLFIMAITQLRGDKKWTGIIVAALIALSVAGLTGRVLKISTGRARPSVKAEQMWNGPRVSGSKYHSFPSGHVDASMGFFGVLLLARRRIGVACLPIPMLIGFSRLYLGAHYLSDVVCGAVLGILAAVIVWHFASRQIVERCPKPAIIPPRS
ncbi:MAG TPA: phosphatase PAP2 family protein [Chthoniobacterales bacterium]|nr:phosphatase PAP2 family protein [Chthoniobacterales bacterium]